MQKPKVSLLSYFGDFPGLLPAYDEDGLKFGSLVFTAHRPTLAHPALVSQGDIALSHVSHVGTCPALFA
jgi:hypothetical protein